MADTVNVETGNGTHERVAFDMAVYITDHFNADQSFTSKDTFLDLYAECRIATFGSRKINRT